MVLSNKYALSVLEFLSVVSVAFATVPSSPLPLSSFALPLKGQYPIKFVVGIDNEEVVVLATVVVVLDSVVVTLLVVVGVRVVVPANVVVGNAVVVALKVVVGATVVVTVVYVSFVSVILYQY